MNLSRIFFLLALMLILTSTSSSTTFAQRSTPATSGELDLLRRDEIREQLGLSELQVEKIADIQKNSTPGTEFFAPYLERMKGKPAEEAAKIREELNVAVAAERAKFQSRAVDVLSDAQKTMLRSIYISQAGVRALSDARIAEDLGLTAEQTAALVQLGEERRQAAQKVSFGSSDDAREKFEQEWAEKSLAVLTADQKKKWDTQAAVATTASTSSQAGTSGTTAPGAPRTTAGNPDAGDPPPGTAAVSSFGTAAEAAEGSAIVEKFSFNFQYAPWENVLKDFATAAGYTLDANVVPPGTFSHLDNNTYTAAETLDILNGYLLRRGFALVKKDGFLVCLDASKNRIPGTLIPDVALDDLPKVGEHEIVRIVIPVDNVDVGVMAQEVETLLGPVGQMSAFTQTGTLIIADAGGNLRRIHHFITETLNKTRPDEIIFKAYPIINMSADEAEFTLLAQFGVRQVALNVSASTEDRRSSSRSSSSTPVAPPLQVLSDPRTNSVLVSGTSKQHTLVAEILKSVDVPELPETARYRNTGPYLHVYTVSGVDAGEVTKSLNAMMPGVVVNEDRRAGKIHISATAKQHAQVAEWIEMFDGGGGSGTVAVIPLVKMDPLSAAATLRSLFLSDGTSAPTIETDLYSRVLIIRGSAEQVTQIKTVLAQLGEDGEGRRKAGEGGPIRRYSLMGRSPEEFLDFVQQSWNSSEPNPIRVVIPRQSGPIRELKTPTGPLPGSPRNRENEARPEAGSPQTQPGRNSLPSNPDADQDADGEPRTTQAIIPNSRQFAGSDEHSSLTPRSYLTSRLLQDNSPQENANQSQDNQQPDNRTQSAATLSSAGGGEIRILVNGDELILMSDDEDALDRMEEMMDLLHQTLPNRISWTVFYLQASDATETAAMLEQLFPNSSVSSSSVNSGFSMSSMLSPLTDTVSNLTGLSGLGNSPQSLRIIPDVRSNSLFVTGPEMVIQEMEQVLRVLDSTEIPESLRDMQPRTLVVKFAEVDDVARIVSDVFKTYMEAPAARQQQNNPFAALMGGGGRGNDPASQVRMTLGVDRQTSTLIISSSESIFQQVQQVVADLDQSAQLSNRSFLVMPLKNANATIVQQTLSSMFPKVTTSTSSSPAQPSSGGSSRPEGDRDRSSGGSSAQDAFQQMMQERMRQQSRGGDTGGRPATGGFPGGFPGGGRGGFPGRR